MSDDERRYKRLLVPYRTIIGILNGTVTVADFVLPDDARVIYVQDDCRYGALSVTVESATYGPVPHGSEIPAVHSFAMRVRRRPEDAAS